MDNLVSWALFIAASSVAIAAVLEAVKQRAEKNAIATRYKELKSHFVASKNENENLKKQLHVFTSSEREEEQKRLIAEQQLVDQLNDEIIP